MRGVRNGMAAAFILLWIRPAAGTDERAEAVDAVFSAWDRDHTPGAVVAVVEDGDIVYEQAFGMADLERAVPLTTESVFDIASISKQFVAASILLLEERGELALKDDIRAHLPGFPDYGERITVQHLIHHTSGIRDYMDLMEMAGMEWENTYPQSEIVDLVARQRGLTHSPGEEFLYTNSGYLLLAEIIHKVSGQRLGEFTEHYIFRPLDMKVSHFYEDATRIVENRALSYSQQASGGFRSVPYIFDVVGDTGLLTSIRDLLRWDRNFYDNVLGDHGPELIERMHARGRLDNGDAIDYAFGLEIGMYRGSRVARHSGGAAGYSTELMRFPDHRFTVMVLSNLAQFSPTELAYQVADVYLADAFTAPKPVSIESDSDRPTESVLPEIDVEDAHAYAGHYYSPELDTMYRLSAVDGTLTFRIGFSPVETRLAPSGRDRWDAGRRKLRFLRDEDGVSGFTLGWGRVQGVSFRRTR